MYAVIHEVESNSTHGLIPIAGRPLVARQIQWLRSARCQGIAVQIGLSAESVALGQWLAHGDAIGTNVRLVLSGKQLSPREIARRAGFPDAGTLLAIPADVLCGGDIEALRAHARPQGSVVALPAPPALADVFDGSAIRVIGHAPPEPHLGEAWAIRVRSLADAFTIAVSALEGRLERRSENGILLHASERGRGIWVGRGVQIDPSAQLVAPILIGANAVICAGARVGPRVFLGERSVVERRTQLANALVAPATIIGADLDLSGVALDARGTQDLFTGEHATIDETLLLARRDKQHRGNIFGRSLAAILLALFAPIWIIAQILKKRRFSRADRFSTFYREDGLWDALVQTFRGQRSFIGLGAWNGELPEQMPPILFWKSMGAPRGFITIDSSLAPEGADASIRLRARVYYLHEKNLALDLRLVLRCIFWSLMRLARKLKAMVDPNSAARIEGVS